MSFYAVFLAKKDIRVLDGFCFLIKSILDVVSSIKINRLREHVFISICKHET